MLQSFTPKIAVLLIRITKNSITIPIQTQTCTFFAFQRFKTLNQSFKLIFLKPALNSIKRANSLHALIFMVFTFWSAFYDNFLYKPMVGSPEPGGSEGPGPGQHPRLHRGGLLCDGVRTHGPRGDSGKCGNGRG